MTSHVVSQFPRERGLCRQDRSGAGLHPFGCEHLGRAVPKGQQHPPEGGFSGRVGGVGIARNRPGLLSHMPDL